MKPRLGRRALFGAAAALAVAPRARAASPVIVGVPPGGFAAFLPDAVDQPLLGHLGVQARQSVAPPDQLRSQVLADRRSQRGGLDVVCLDDVEMYALSLAQPFHFVTATDVADLPHAAPPLRVPYAVPVASSAIVLAYNTEKEARPPEAYADLWDPRWKGRVGFSDQSYLSNIAVATLASGGTMRDFGPGEARLRGGRALQPRFYPSDEALGAALRGGEVWVAPALLAHVYAWRQAGGPVAHAVAAEGAIPMTIMAAVLRNAPDRPNGFAYLNALLDPRVQAALATRLGYMPTVDNAHAPPDVLKAVSFSAGQQQRFRSPAYDYLARNLGPLSEFWHGELRA